MVIDGWAGRVATPDITDGILLVRYPLRGLAIDIYENYWDGPVTDLFRMERFGPPISILKLSN